MPKIRELIVQWTSKFDKKGLVDFNREVDKGKGKAKDTEDAVKKLTDSFAKMGVAIGAAVLLSRVRDLTSQFIAMGDEAGKTAAQLGISTDELQAFRFAAESSGASSELMSNALAKLQLRMREATTGSAEARKIFKDLGVDFKDAEGNLRPVTDVFRDIADVIARTENPAIRTGLVMKAFEEEGRRLTPMLAAGSAGIEQMLRQFRGLGGGLSQDAIRRSEELTDALTRMRVSGLSLASVLAATFIPKMISLIDWMTRAVQWIREVTENSHILRATAITVGAALTAVGIATAAAWGPAALTVGLTTAAILLTALAVDDLWLTVEGGDTVLSNFIDGMTEVGTTAQMVDNVTQAWVDLTDTMQAAWDFIGPTLLAFGEWLGGWEGISKGIINFLLPIIPAAEALWNIVKGISESLGLGVHVAGVEDVSQQEVERQRRIRETESRARRGRQQRRERRAEEQAVFEAGVELLGTPEAAMGLEQVGLEQSIWMPGEVALPIPRAAARRRPRMEARRPSPVIMPHEAAPSMMALPAAGGGSQVVQNIGDVSTTVNVTVQGGGDPAQAAREFRRVAHDVVREERDRELRQLEVLAPVGVR